MAINHAVNEAARRACPTDKRSSCHFLLNRLCQRQAVLLLRKVRGKVTRGRQRKRETETERKVTVLRDALEKARVACNSSS